MVNLWQVWRCTMWALCCVRMLEQCMGFNSFPGDLGRWWSHTVVVCRGSCLKTTLFGEKSRSAACKMFQYYMCAPPQSARDLPLYLAFPDLCRTSRLFKMISRDRVSRLDRLSSPKADWGIIHEDAPIGSNWCIQVWCDSTSIKRWHLLHRVGSALLASKPNWKMIGWCDQISMKGKSINPWPRYIESKNQTSRTWSKHLKKNTPSTDSTWFFSVFSDTALPVVPWLLEATTVLQGHPGWFEGTTFPPSIKIMQIDANRIERIVSYILCPMYVSIYFS